MTPSPRSDLDGYPPERAGGLPKPQHGGSGPTLDAIFAATARRHRDRVAVDVPPGRGRPRRRRVSYGALWDAAMRLAEQLGPLQADGLVAIFLPREAPELYAAQLGAMHAGGAFLCLDGRFPDAQLERILEDASPLAVIGDAKAAARLTGLDIALPRWIDVERFQAEEHDGAAAAMSSGAERPSATDGRSVPAASGVPTSSAISMTSATSATSASDASDRSDRHLAYVIYTSGTTGRPKGVMIEHRGIVNLVRSDADLFGLGPGDRVAQISSPAYDSSIEESFLAFTVGATLVPIDDDTARLGPDLVPWLREERIHVLCPPPTLLRTMGAIEPAAALPELQVLYVGGEALSDDLAERWAPGPRMVNGYGPTECSVTVTRAEVQAGRPITIGRPVDGNRAWVLDERLDPVTDGEAGELCISGVGLARGYLGRDALTASRFPLHATLGRIYRTGDLVRRNEAGDLEYLGRIDAQVKLRGYRIELGAVEAKIAEQPGVRAAACRLQGEGAAQWLAAHVLPSDPARPPDLDGLREALRAELPEYMVPARIALAERLPTSVSGKLMRDALPAIESASPTSRKLCEAGGSAAPRAAPQEREPRADPEGLARAAFAHALDLAKWPDPDADFFLDLGGDSLSAVMVVLDLREQALEPAPVVRDLYEARSARALAANRRIGREERSPVGAGMRSERATGEAGHPASARRAAPFRIRVAATLVQSAWLAVGLIVASALGYLTVFVLAPLYLGWLGLDGALLAAPLLGLVLRLAGLPLGLAITLAAKRLLIGRYRPMRVPVWSGFYLRHWMVSRCARLIPWGLIEGGAFTNRVLGRLGARVADDAHVHRGVALHAGGWDLLDIGAGATLAQDSAARTVTLDAGELVIGPVSIGAGATLDVRAGMDPGASLGEGSFLTALSWLPPGDRVPDGERWSGVPASREGAAPAAHAPAGPAPGGSGPSGRDAHVAGASSGSAFWAAELSPTRHAALLIGAKLAVSLLGGLAAALALLGLSRVAGVDGAAVLAWLNAPTLSWGLCLWLAGASALLLGLSLLLQAATLRLMGRVEAGVYPRTSPAAVRIWQKTGMVSRAGDWLSGSLLWPPWLRLAGMQLGRRCEISSIIDVLPETIQIGDESFFADGIYLCAPRRHRGRIEVATTRIGAGTFLGNHALLPAGHDWPEGLFLGVATVADAGSVRPHSAWFGAPPIDLPRRARVEVDRGLTHEPNALRWLTRLAFEALRFGLPALPLIAFALWIVGVEAARATLHPAAFWLLGLPSLTLGSALLPCLSLLALKWLLLGRVKPGRHAFWSFWCARWDLVYMAWNRWARGLLSMLEGSLLLAPYLRLAGMEIGRGVILGEGFAQVVDPDMLRLDDGATVACQFQAHTFEDRILKIDRLRIGAGASVGPQTVVFYGVDVGDGARVAPHGVVMKRDRLDEGGRYEGNPVRPRSTGTADA